MLEPHRCYSSLDGSVNVYSPLHLSRVGRADCPGSASSGSAPWPDLANGLFANMTWEEVIMVFQQSNLAVALDGPGVPMEGKTGKADGNSTYSIGISDN